MKLQAKVNLKTELGLFDFSAYSDDEGELMPHLLLSNLETITEETVVNLRIHSECITGDLFGSCRCDCGPQLNASMNYINSNGGMLIYLRQEGRGIGIINKIKAYNQQDLGFDTAEANRNLGFDYDARVYDEALAILESLGVTKVNLLTNNPEKLSAFENSKITVIDRVPLEIKPHLDNRSYLKTKKDFFGHLLDLV